VRANHQELSTSKQWGDLSVADADHLAQRCSGSCGHPHWGYVIRGSMRVAYPDHDEVISAGDAYYVAPGHVAVQVGGAELVDFSPTGPPGSRPIPTTEET
jgi:hypothetical protein